MNIVPAILSTLLHPYTEEVLFYQLSYTLIPVPTCWKDLWLCALAAPCIACVTI